MSDLTKTHFSTYNKPDLVDEIPLVLALCEFPVVEPVTLCVWDDLPVGTKLDLSAVNSIDTCMDCYQKVRKQSGTIYALKAAAALRKFVEERETDG